MALQARDAPPWARPVCRRKRPAPPSANLFRRKVRRLARAAPNTGLLLAEIAAVLCAAFLLLSLSFFAVPPRRAARAEAVAALAEALEGSRYAAGGDSPSGFDCSGYTAYVYKTAAELPLPHSAATQAEMGEPVALAELAPGDLVFFGTAGKGAVTHCGIYLGGGVFLAANSGAGERVSRESLSAPYWAEKFLFGRRLLGNAAGGPNGTPP